MTTITDEHVERIAWPQAVQRIKSYGLGKACSALIAAANEAAKSMKSADAVVFVAKYPFGNHVIQGKNKFTLPCGKSATIDKLATTVPMCLVLKNMFEVYRPSFGGLHGPDLPKSLRLLHPGDLFGVFEVANQLCNSDHQKDDWWVSAGARSARFVYPLDNEAVLHFLNDTVSSVDKELSNIIKGLISKKHSNQPGAVSQVVDLEDKTWRLMVGLSAALKTNWIAEIMAFPPQWMKGKSSHRLQNQVLRAAWLQAQDQIRREVQFEAIKVAATNVDHQIHDIVHEEGVGAADGTQLLACLADAAEGRTAVHVVSATADADTVECAGPFRQIIDGVKTELIKKRRGDKRITPVVLVPAYLQPGASGFLSFSRPTAPLSVLEANRRSDVLSGASSTIRAALKAKNVETLNALQSLIPQLDWPPLVFYGAFNESNQKEHEHFKMLATLAKGDGAALHCTNKFFLHCARVTRRSST